ncbi:MAG: HNH endonuclease [Proteobacteria bacterium]|nr:HNH endonuclease [Pseudomonadota bacterium]
MPFAAKRPCAHAGCSSLVSGGQRKCDVHRKQLQREHDARRGSASERGYTSRWTKARATYLRSRPLCLICKTAGRLVPATVVDHIVPHRGDQTLFWDSENNWQPLCKSCHDRKTATEDGGFGNPGTSAAVQKSDSGSGRGW